MRVGMLGNLYLYFKKGNVVLINRTKVVLVKFLGIQKAECILVHLTRIL